jgi:hypothetical protein
MKRKTEDGTSPFAVRLPRELQERLRRAGGERGIGEEIRKRLEKSFEAEKTPKRPADPKFQELLLAIAFVVAKLKTHFGDLWEDRFSFEVFKSALDLWLEAIQPEGEPVMKPNPNRASPGAFFAPDASPESVARAILVNWAWLQEERGGEATIEIGPQLIAAVMAVPGHSPSEDDVMRIGAKLAERKRR